MKKLDMSKVGKILVKIGIWIRVILIILIVTLFILWHNLLSKIDKPLSPKEVQAGKYSMERFEESIKLQNKEVQK